MFDWLRRKGKTIDEVARDIDDATRGVSVTQSAALEESVVFACLDIIASSVATPELEVMRRGNDGRSQKATDLSSYRLLHRRPNEWQTSFEFRQMMTCHAVLAEEAIAVKAIDGRTGEISELLPVLPQWVTRIKRGRYETVYRLADEFGEIGTFSHDQLLIIRNHSWDLMKGLSAVQQARKAIGLAIAAEENLTTLHANGGRPSGILSTEGELSDAAIQRLKKAWDSVTRGSGRGRTAVLDQNMKFSTVAMNQVDAQTLETRRLQVEEICRAMGVYPIMVGHSDKAATYASAESFFAAHNRRTTWRWQSMWAQRLDEFVLDGAGPLYVKFDNREKQLATLRDQSEFYARALGSGGSTPFMTVNEVRELLGLDPIDGGDELREPAASTVAPIEGNPE